MKNLKLIKKYQIKQRKKKIEKMIVDLNVKNMKQIHKIGNIN